MDKIPFSCLGESDDMMRGEGRGGGEKAEGGAAVQTGKKIEG